MVAAGLISATPSAACREAREALVNAWEESRMADEGTALVADQ